MNVHQLCGKGSGKLTIEQEEKNLQELKLLMLRSDTNLNAVDDNGRTILHYASGFGYQKVFNSKIEIILADRGFTLESCGNGRSKQRIGRRRRYRQIRPKISFFHLLSLVILNIQTPIHRAAQYGHTQIVQSLLQYGADFTTPDLAGDTPLHLSVGTGKLSVSKLLLDKGASIFVPNNQQSFPFDKALLLHKTQPRVMPPQLLNETEKLLHKELTNTKKRIFNPNNNSSPPPKRAKEDEDIPSSQNVTYDDIQYKIYKCKDGHHVRSNFERNICDWLWEHDFLHAYEMETTVTGPDGDKITLRPDFYLKKENVYIEFWGLTGDVNYDEKRQLKLAAYKHNGMKVLELFEDQMRNYNNVLSNLLIKKKF